VTEQSINVFSGLKRIAVGWIRDFDKNSVTGRHIGGNANGPNMAGGLPCYFSKNSLF
jgi:hypothetical protein